MACERQVEGHVALQIAEDYVCSMCKNTGSEPVSQRAEMEERETHVDVDTQPTQSDMDCEPTHTDSTEPGQTVTQSRCEVEDMTEHKQSGKIKVWSDDLASSCGFSGARFCVLEGSSQVLDGPGSKDLKNKSSSGFLDFSTWNAQAFSFLLLYFKT